MTQLTENEQKLINFIGEKYQSGQISDECLTQLIELCGGFLGLKTISDYAKVKKMSYNGIKKCREIKTILCVKFVKDNA